MPDATDYQFDDDPPDGSVICPRCNGNQTVHCHCGGDLCICDNFGEADCPLCGGEFCGAGYVNRDVAEAYEARRREMAEAFHQAFRNAGFAND